MLAGRFFLFMRAATIVFSRLLSPLWRSLKSLVAGRSLYVIGAGIAVLCLLLGTRIYSLYKELGRKNFLISRLARGIQERDRILRELGAQTGSGALDPLALHSQLSQSESKIYSLKFKLRNMEMEIQKLRDELSRREGDVVGLREQLSKRDNKMRALMGEVRYQEKNAEGLKSVNQEISKKVSRLSVLEKETALKKKEIATLKKKNTELTERIFRMQRSAESLQVQLEQAQAQAQAQKKGAKPQN